MDYKRGTRIVMDEDKIKREGIYDLENEKDLAALAIFNFHKLVEQEWFTKNVKEWTWINKEEGDENLIEHFKNENEGVWV